MAGNLTDDEEEITGINVTPLVDVMLVLLIIFMVTTTYIVNRSISLTLPEAETAQSAEGERKNLTFALDQKSHLYLNGKPVEFEHIASQIEAARSGDKENKGLQAVISADIGTPHGAVVRLIDAIRKQGITDFAIDVDSSASNTKKASDKEEVLQ